MSRYYHPRDREKIKWKTKSGQSIIIRDISNRHLDNIIIHIKSNINHYGQDLLNLMETEEAYRHNNGINIPDYADVPTFINPSYENIYRNIIEKKKCNDRETTSYINQTPYRTSDWITEGERGYFDL